MAQIPELTVAAKKGISALSAYLDELITGSADQPMRLLPAYIELNRARGASDATEGDLFYPNLGIELPLPDDAKQVLDEAVLSKALAQLDSATAHRCDVSVTT